MSDEYVARNSPGYMRNYYHTRKKLGLCVRCGQKIDLINRTKCAECLAKDAERHAGMAMTETQKARRKDLYDVRKRKGLCVVCGRPAYKGHVRCYECYIRHKRHSAEYRRRNKKERVAPYGQPPPHKPGEKHPWNLDNRLIFRRTTSMQNGGDNR